MSAPDGGGGSLGTLTRQEPAGRAPMSETGRGTLLGALAYLCWGLFPLYWPLLEPANPVEILSHRVVWSLVFVAAALTVRRQWTWLHDYRRDRRRLLLLAGAAAVIAVNWGMYIYGVNSHHVVETSLGYFVNPLVTVLLGVVVLGERLRPLQWGATAVVALSVLGIAVDLGRPPWIALVLALSFATYALLKKKADAGALESLTVETATLVVPAVGVLVALQVTGQAELGRHAGRSLLLVGTGVVTAVPLLLFGGAATRIPLVTIGLLQYLAPTLQFLCGVLVYGEALPPARLLGFAGVWLGLALFTYDTLAHRRRQLALAAEAPA